MAAGSLIEVRLPSSNILASRLINAGVFLRSGYRFVVENAKNQQAKSLILRVAFMSRQNRMRSRLCVDFGATGH
jgi:hypothetical protein